VKVSFEPGSRLLNIGPSAFLDCRMLESICLPSSIETLEKGVFDGCTALSKVTFEPGGKFSRDIVRFRRACHHF
jgi:hypothetical protein